MTIKARQAEYDKIKNTIEKYKKMKDSTILYLYGVPGSGKTYTIKAALNSSKYAYINCNNIGTKSKIYSTIQQSLYCNNGKQPFTLLSLVEHLQTCKQPHIIILDEVDLLRTKTQSIFYNIFSLPYYPNSSVLLITVSNSFNLLLDDKILSRIGNNKIMFKTYKSDQLMEIIGDNSKVTEYLTRRVAAISGDARKALALYKKCKNTSVEQTELEIRNKENNLLSMFVHSLTKINKLFLLNYYNEYKINDAYESFNTQLRIQGICEIDFIDFNKMIVFLCDTHLISIKKGTIIYYHIKDELEKNIKI